MLKLTSLEDFKTKTIEKADKIKELETISKKGSKAELEKVIKSPEKTEGATEKKIYCIELICYIKFYKNYFL